MEPVSLRTKADPEPDGAEGLEVRGAGRVTTDQGIAGGTRKGGAWHGDETDLVLGDETDGSEDLGLG